MKKLLAKSKEISLWLLRFFIATMLVIYLPMLAGALFCAYWAVRTKGGPYIKTTAAFIAGWVFTFFSLSFAEVCIFMTMAPIKEIADRTHDAGGLMYYDGANLNAIMGKFHPGAIGVDRNPASRADVICDLCSGQWWDRYPYR